MDTNLYRLRATKAKMYKLAKAYYQVRARQKDTYFSSSEPGSYFLDFRQGNAEYHVFLAMMSEIPTLGFRITRRDVDDHELTYEDIIRLSTATLQKFGLLEKL